MLCWEAKERGNVVKPRVQRNGSESKQAKDHHRGQGWDGRPERQKEAEP